MKLICYGMFILILNVTTGCATPKILQATGGSKADGVIDLSYEYGAFEQPVVDMNQGLIVAIDRCKAWG